LAAHGGRWAATAIERDNWGLAAMAKTAMGRVGKGTSARWDAMAMGRAGEGTTTMGRDGDCARRLGPGGDGRDGNGTSARWDAMAMCSRLLLMVLA